MELKIAVTMDWIGRMTEYWHSGRVVKYWQMVLGVLYTHVLREREVAVAMESKGEKSRLYS